MKLRTSIAQVLLPKILHAGLPFLLMLVMAPGLQAQSIEFSKAKSAAEKDSVNFEAKGLPSLVPLSGDSLLKPYYSYLWIFGDGNFINGTRAHAVRHRYEVKPGTTDTFEIRTFSSDSYSGGDPPPVLRSTPVIIDGNTDSIPFNPSTAVADGSLHLQRNHEVRPEDTLVNILSFKNTSSQEPLSGQIYLFYNSPVTTKAPKNTKGKFRSSVSSAFSQFNFEESLVYYDNVDTNTYAIDTVITKLGANFEKALLFDYNNLRPGEEQHLFVVFNNDSTLTDLITGSAINEVQFMAVMTSFNQDTLLGQTDINRLNDLGVYGFLDTLNQLNTDVTAQQGLDITDFQGDLATNVVDVFDMTAQLVRAHDPNQIRVDGCQCPGENDAHKLIFTVDCENDGSAITKNVFIDIEIPEELEFNSIYDTLISYHPSIAEGTAGQIELTKDINNRTIRWSLLNFGLLPTQDLGYGHPATQAQIVFSALTKPGIDLADIPELRACIRFVDQPGEEVCTLPVTVTPITAEQGSDILPCEDCNCPETLLSIWAWICGAIIALFTCIVLYFRSRNTTPTILTKELENQKETDQDKDRVLKFS